MLNLHGSCMCAVAFSAIKFDSRRNCSSMLVKTVRRTPKIVVYMADNAFVHGNAVCSVLFC